MAKMGQKSSSSRETSHSGFGFEGWGSGFRPALGGGGLDFPGGEVQGKWLHFGTTFLKLRKYTKETTREMTGSSTDVGAKFGKTGTATRPKAVLAGTAASATIKYISEMQGGRGGGAYGSAVADAFAFMQQLGNAQGVAVGH